MKFIEFSDFNLNGESIGTFEMNEKEIDIYFEVNNIVYGYDNGEGDCQDSEFEITIIGSYIMDDGEISGNLILNKKDILHIKQEIKNNIKL